MTLDKTESIDSAYGDSNTVRRLTRRVDLLVNQLNQAQHGQFKAEALNAIYCALEAQGAVYLTKAAQLILPDVARSYNGKYVVYNVEGGTPIEDYIRSWLGEHKEFLPRGNSAQRADVWAGLGNTTRMLDVHGVGIELGKAVRGKLDTNNK